MPMQIVMPMLRLVPKRLARRMDAPFLFHDLIVRGRDHPTIRMNLENLLLCACRTCPSFPGNNREALYCSGGKSMFPINEKGCNCVICPLYDRCSSFNVAYFCIHGQCGAKDERPVAARIKDLAGSYLERFTSLTEELAIPPEREPHQDLDRPVTLHFEGEKDVQTTSSVTILMASLGAGIPHTHVCGGRARCSTCRVLISRGLDHCRPRNADETRLARIKGFSPEVRLACQTTVTDDVSLRRLVLDDLDIRAAIQEGRTDAGEAGREAEVSVLFCDIRSFTAFAERALPYDVIHILNRYFEILGEVIDRHGGYIDKYMGDGIMVVFGLDRALSGDHARLAVSAARDIMRSLPEFNEFLRARYNHEFKIGIGVHSGTVILGSLGYHKKKEYTALGDTVNTASRIEAINKETGTVVLVSEETHDLVKEGFTWGRNFSKEVKGKKGLLLLYELLMD